MSFHHFRFIAPCSAFVILALGGCREARPTVYSIPKETIASKAVAPPSGSPHGTGVFPAPAMVPPMANTAVATAAGAELSWIAPAGWQSKPASSMRKASYVLGEGTLTADLGITAFPGDVGGEAANVNRWRGQLGLAPLSPEAAVAALSRLETHGLKIAWLELAGEANGAPARLLGAMVPFGGATWFFKILGPEATIEKEKPAFREFLKTLQPATPQP